jgi:hypothetical protein
MHAMIDQQPSIFCFYRRASTTIYNSLHAYVLAKARCLYRDEENNLPELGVSSCKLFTATIWISGLTRCRKCNLPFILRGKKITFLSQINISCHDSPVTMKIIAEIFFIYCAFGHCQVTKLIICDLCDIKPAFQNAADLLTLPMLQGNDPS